MPHGFLAKPALYAARRQTHLGPRSSLFKKGRTRDIACSSYVAFDYPIQSEYHAFLRDCPAELRCCPRAAYARYYRWQAPCICRRGILSKIFDGTWGGFFHLQGGGTKEYRRYFKLRQHSRRDNPPICGPWYSDCIGYIDMSKEGLNAKSWQRRRSVVPLLVPAGHRQGAAGPVSYTHLCP